MVLNRYQFSAMGCPCELRFFTKSAKQFSRTVKRCVAEIRRFERKYSGYRPDSLATEINRSAGRKPVRIDHETAALLRYAAVCHEQSGGSFDMTSGVFRRVWHRGRTTLPAQRELDTCIAKVGWDKVQFSEQEIFLPIPGMELDFGGVVKEYAADAAAELAGKAGIRHGLINLGGDIRIVGPQPDEQPWPLGIAHPHRTGTAIATLPLMAGALATSGSYERFIEIAGRQYGHLVDPRTGWPIDGLLSVSVVARQAIVAGSLASVAMLLGRDGGLAWLKQCGAPYLAVDPELSLHGQLADH